MRPAASQMASWTVLRLSAPGAACPSNGRSLLDSLQTERDQGITIDTSQIRFRTPSRDILRHFATNSRRPFKTQK